MRAAFPAALAAVLCHAPGAAAWERPSHDPTIEAAAIAVLQKKLPDLRKSHDIGEEPVIVRGAQLDERPQGISAFIDLDADPAYPGRIIWL